MPLPAVPLAVRAQLEDHLFFKLSQVPQTGVMSESSQFLEPSCSEKLFPLKWMIHSHLSSPVLPSEPGVDSHGSLLGSPSAPAAEFSTWQGLHRGEEGGRQAKGCLELSQGKGNRSFHMRAKGNALLSRAHAPGRESSVTEGLAWGAEILSTIHRPANTEPTN